MMTFERDQKVRYRTGELGVVITPAYEQVPYVQVDFGSHTIWVYPHELTPDETEILPESEFAKFIYSVIDGNNALSDILDFTDPEIPQYAKDVMYGFIEGHNSATRHINGERIAALIREIDGDHTMGAGELGEALATRLKGEK